MKSLNIKDLYFVEVILVLCQDLVQVKMRFYPS